MIRYQDDTGNVCLLNPRAIVEFSAIPAPVDSQPSRFAVIAEKINGDVKVLGHFADSVKANEFIEHRIVQHIRNTSAVLEMNKRDR